MYLHPGRGVHPKVGRLGLNNFLLLSLHDVWQCGVAGLVQTKICVEILSTPCPRSGPVLLIPAERTAGRVMLMVSSPPSISRTTVSPASVLLTSLANTPCSAAVSTGSQR